MLCSDETKPAAFSDIVHPLTSVILSYSHQVISSQLAWLPNLSSSDVVRYIVTSVLDVADCLLIWHPGFKGLE
jgi:hypothetical protein